MTKQYAQTLTLTRLFAPRPHLRAGRADTRVASDAYLRAAADGDPTLRTYLRAEYPAFAPEPFGLR